MSDCYEWRQDQMVRTIEEGTLDSARLDIILLLSKKIGRRVTEHEKFINGTVFKEMIWCIPLDGARGPWVFPKPA